MSTHIDHVADFLIDSRDMITDVTTENRLDLVEYDGDQERLSARSTVRIKTAVKADDATSAGLQLETITHHAFKFLSACGIAVDHAALHVTPGKAQFGEIEFFTPFNKSNVDKLPTLVALIQSQLNKPDAEKPQETPKV